MMTGEGLLLWRKHYYVLWTYILARSGVLIFRTFYKHTAFHFIANELMDWSGVVWITCGYFLLQSSTDKGNKALVFLFYMKYDLTALLSDVLDPLFARGLIYN